LNSPLIAVGSIQNIEDRAAGHDPQDIVGINTFPQAAEDLGNLALSLIDQPGSRRIVANNTAILGGYHRDQHERQERQEHDFLEHFYSP
jgi:hypothetical protein